MIGIGDIVKDSTGRLGTVIGYKKFKITVRFEVSKLEKVLHRETIKVGDVIEHSDFDLKLVATHTQVLNNYRDVK